MKKANKNSDNKIIKKSLYSLGTVALATSVTFAAVGPLAFSKNNNSLSIAKSNNALSQQGNTQIGIESQPANKTPAVLYNLPIFNDKYITEASSSSNGTGNLFKVISNIFKSLGAYKLDTAQDIYKQYLDSIGYIATNNILGAQNGLANNTSVQQNFTDAQQIYINPDTIFSNYNTINGIGSTVDSKQVLEITKPLEVRDIASTDAAVPISNTTDNKLNTDNFEYKVAEIDLDKLKDAGSLVFKYTDDADVNAKNHDYRIVISNENRELDTFLKDPSKNADISNLLANQTIFIRDLNQTATAPDTNNAIAPQTLPTDKFRFTYDAANKKLSLLVKPSDNNVKIDLSGNAHPDNSIKVGVDIASSGKEAVKSSVLSWGILDNTLSPLHVKKIDSANNPIDSLASGGALNHGSGSTYLTDPVDTPLAPTGTAVEIISNQLKVFSYKAAWHLNDHPTFSDTNKPYTQDANWIRFYMGRNNKFEKPLQFAGKTDPDNFQDGSPTDLSIVYNTSQVQISPKSGFVIRKNQADAAGKDLTNSSILIRTSEINRGSVADNDSILKTEIILNRGVMSIAATGTNGADEQELQVPSIAKKFFFEDPYAVPAPKATETEIRTSAQQEVADKNLELIADVLTNWSNQTTTESNKIVSYSEFVELLKKNNQSDFADLDAANQALLAAKNTQANLPANSSQSIIDHAKQEVETAQADLDRVVKKIQSYAPLWKYADAPTIDNPKDTPMIFDVSLIDKDDTLKPYVYQYKHFYVDETTGAITSDDANVFGVFERPKDAKGETDYNGNFVLDKDGKPVPVLTDGKAIYQDFKGYNDEIVRWSEEKLGLSSDEFGFGQKGDYEIPNTGIMGWAQTHLINVAGAEGDELRSVANVLARIWIGNPLVSTEQDVVDQINSAVGKQFPNWQNIVSNKANPANYTGNKVDTKDNGYLLSKQYIYAILQPYFVKVFNKILDIETTKLETNMKLSLRDTFQKFFDSTSDMKKINDDSIKNIDTANDPKLTNMKLVATGTYGLAQAQNGLDSLKSLMTFIYNAGLQNRFLNESDANVFETFAKNNCAALDDVSIFEDANKKAEFVKVMQLTSNIIDKTFNKNQDYVSLAKIVNKIQSNAYDTSKSPSTALSDLTDTINLAITTIANNVSYNQMSLLGQSTNYTYLESLVMGKNLHEILQKYIANREEENKKNNITNDESLKSIQTFLGEQKEYDTTALTNFAVSLGYYNFDYFIKSLTDQSKVTNMAKELLSKDLENQFKLRIDSSNQIVSFLSNPQNLAKYAFMGIGGASALIGGSIFGLSFRKSVRTSRKNVILERAIFIGIAALGVALALVGIIPGII